MAMVSCRKAFTAKLLQNAKKNADIFAVATDSRGSVTLGEFGKQLPDRLIEFGIADALFSAKKSLFSPNKAAASSIHLSAFCNIPIKTLL